MTRVVIVDDHTLIRRGLALILSAADDVALVGGIGSSDDLFALLDAIPVDVLLMNLAIGTEGIEVLRRIRADFPRLPVLTYNSHADEIAMKALRAGASGYLPKETSPEELAVAIRRLAAGGTYLSKEMAEKIAGELAHGVREQLYERLSRRELEVFRLIGAGRSVSEIAKKLKLSVKTVSTHRARILDKTGLRNNAEIIRYLILNG